MKIIAALLAAVMASPAVAAVSREDLQKALAANPDLVLEALGKADQAKFFEQILKAQQEFQMKRQKEEEAAEKKELDDRMKDPFKPEITDATRVRGDRKAPITVVEYSDIQCPVCGNVFPVVEDLRKKYGSRLRFVYKHFPLTRIHPNALPAAQWQEAVALQSPEKAWLFLDKMFQNQQKLSADYYRQTVKELGLNVAKAEKDALSDKVKAKIDADTNEAEEFKFNGTPGFLVNGVPIRGAAPLSQFDMIIGKLGLGS